MNLFLQWSVQENQQVIFNRSNRPLQHWNISHFISCRLNNAGAKYIECPVTISKGESLNSTRDGYKI